ncbi:hypothetical protein AB0M79_09480 [Polymorphospora sp. NPDC051019]|uniref:hypothetical protein n=1 Tax=Polymorphospora sp. NPDC051019 TaxID=3155725 RepID=UPI00344A3B41
MTDFVLAAAEPTSMLSHMALYGLAAIAEDGGLDDVRVSWTGGMATRPVLSAPDATPETVGEIVRAHATRLAAPDAWPAQSVSDTETKGLMSPRLSVIASRDGWQSLQQRRHDALDRLTEARAYLDLRLIAALGEPSYWRFNKQGQRLQDDGASRLEMQPRNQGSEFVGSRIRKLATALTARTNAAVSDGLLGRSIRDEIGKDAATSRTSTGFASPGPVDNALAWCALWGISQFPIALRTHGFAITTGHLGPGSSGHFYVPVWEGKWRTAKLRSVVGSGQLARFASADLSSNADMSDGENPRAQATAWLASRGVDAVVRFPIGRFGSDSAPERRAMRGVILKTGRR